MNPLQRTGQQHAFTLVELLVVVAIIVALLAILLPSLNRAIEASYRVSCASNMHQWHVASLAYGTDNFGLYPDNRDGQGASWVGPIVRRFWERYLLRIDNGVTTQETVLYCPTQQYHRAYAIDNPAAVNETGIGGKWLCGYFWLPARADDARYDYAAYNTSDPKGSDLVTYKRIGGAPPDAPILADMKQYYAGVQGKWNGWFYGGVPQSSHARPDGEAAGGNFLFEAGQTLWYDSDTTNDPHPGDVNDRINVGAQFGWLFYYRVD